MACTVGWVQSPPTFCTMSETVCDLANDAMQLQGHQAHPHWLNTIPKAMDDCDRSMTPRAREAENAEANLALKSMPCLSRDVIVMPASRDSGPDLCLSEEAMRWTENNKQQQAKEVASPSNAPLTRPLANADVFVDDFIQPGQGGPRRMHAIRGTSGWHAVNQVLAQPAETSAEWPKATSIKKLQKGDGSWTTRKVPLG